MKDHIARLTISVFANDASKRLKYRKVFTTVEMLHKFPIPYEKFFEILPHINGIFKILISDLIAKTTFTRSGFFFKTEKKMIVFLFREVPLPKLMFINFFVTLYLIYGGISTYY